ncbi:MAG: hypothetical protein KKB59_20090 [Spirochaetes bacterium]|nr:hypothetical protein [Spirochaetota bacterium]
MSISNVARYCLLAACFFGVLTIIANSVKIDGAQIVFAVATLFFIGLCAYDISIQRKRRLEKLQRIRDQWMKKIHDREANPPTCAAAQ